METQANYEVKPDMQLVPYSLEAATIETLKSKYLDVTIPPDDKAAYSMVMSGLRECREIRLAVDAWHKEHKEWIVKAGKHYDTERRRVHALVEPIEVHLAAVRKVEDERREAIKAEAERKERERVEGIRAKIEKMKAIPSKITPLTTTAEIETVYQKLLAWEPVSEDNYQEFTHEAIAVYNGTVAAVLEIKEKREKWEAEQAAAKVEAERLKKIQVEQEAEREKTRKEREALEAERRKLEAEKKALEDAKKAEKERLERAEFERKTQEEAKARAEQAHREKVEHEAKEATERAEKERVEKERQEAVRPDKEKIVNYITALMRVPVPDIGTETAKQLFDTATSALKKWAKKLIQQAEAL